MIDVDYLQGELKGNVLGTVSQFNPMSNNFGQG
jgi:hypothetical protein